MRKKRVYFLFIVIVLIILFFLQGRIDITTAFVTGSPPPSLGVPTLKVATYNIRGCRDDQGLADVKAIAEEIKQLGADIIALQEVDNGLPRSHFADQAKEIAEHLQMNYVYSPALNFLVGTYGNALISRYPITSVNAVDLPFLLEPRGLIEATIDINGYALQVFTTHLGLKKSERIEQFDFLYDYLRQNAASTAVLLGDFNTLENDPLLLPIRAQFDDPVFNREMKLVTVNGSSTYGMIDHIFLTPNLTFVDVYSPTTGRSDHYPVCLTFSLPMQAE